MTFKRRCLSNVDISRRADASTPDYEYKKSYFTSSEQLLLLISLLYLSVCSLNLDKQTAKGSTALHYCCLTDNSECLKLLLRGKASIDIGKQGGLYSFGFYLLSVSVHLK